jgi:hypothetical protein
MGYVTAKIIYLCQIDLHYFVGFARVCCRQAPRRQEFKVRYTPYGLNICILMIKAIAFPLDSDIAPAQSPTKK